MNIKGETYWNEKNLCARTPPATDIVQMQAKFARLKVYFSDAEKGALNQSGKERVNKYIKKKFVIRCLKNGFPDRILIVRNFISFHFAKEQKKKFSVDFFSSYFTFSNIAPLALTNVKSMGKHKQNDAFAKRDKK